MSIYIFQLLSDSYIQKKKIQRRTRKIIFGIIIFRKIILIFLAQESYIRRSSYTRRLIVIQGDLIKSYKIVMSKTKVEVYRKVLRDVSQNFEGAENLIKQRIEELWEQKKISVEEVSYFYIFIMFLLL